MKIVIRADRESIEAQSCMDVRLDRLATLYLASPLRRFVAETSMSIPILMYHSIAEEDETGTHPYYRTTTSPTAFAAQMEYLQANGYQTCSMTDAINLMHSDTGKALKRVVITFDDGFRDFYRQAFPVLNRFGFSAIVFLPTAYIGERTRQFKGRDCLTWSEVRELQKYGISFGSHTVTHPQLRNLDETTVEKEIVNSKKAIEQKTGVAVDSFAYPYAFPQSETEFKKVLRESLCRARYHNGVCTIVGRAGCGSDPFFLERLPVNSLDDTALFQAKLKGAYDWICRFQFVAKTARSTAVKLYRQSLIVSNELCAVARKSKTP
jgi:peptidoglycan/xylan/chitin deacetylase (PgdA/CDA1 family)